MGKSKLLGALAFGLASVMNPAFFTGCGSVIGPKFSFGEAEVVALVDVAKAQRYELRTADGRYEIMLDVAQVRGDDSKSSALEPAPVKLAHACGNRTFLRSAAACIDSTEVPVAGTLTVKRVSPEVANVVESADVTGTLRVFGTTLSNARLEVAAGQHTLYLQSDDAKTFKVIRLVVDGKALDAAPSGG